MPGRTWRAPGEDVTLIDPWPANVETMKAKGLKVSHIRDVPEWSTPVRALHLTELQQAAKGKAVRYRLCLHEVV